MFLSQAVDAFSEHRTHFEDGHSIVQKTHLRRWLCRWSSVRIDAITPDAVHEYLSELIIKDVTKEEVREEARSLSLVFSWALDEQLVTSNPLDAIEPLHRRAVRRPLEWNAKDQLKLLAVLTPNDENRRFTSHNVLAKLLLNHVDREWQVPYLHPLVLLGLRTGLRLGYLVYLEWRHVFLEEQLIQLPSAETRWGEPLKVSLDLDCLEVLSAIQAHARRVGATSSRVFDSIDLPYDGKVPDVNVIQVHLRAACARAGIREGEFNCVRLSFAYNAIRRGLHWIEATRLVDWDDTQPLIELYERASPRRQVG